jgi:hypothetical protein
LLNFSPSNVLELLFECFVEPSVENRIWEGRRHSDQVTKRETNSTHLLVLKRHFANLFMLLFWVLDILQTCTLRSKPLSNIASKNVNNENKSFLKISYNKKTFVLKLRQKKLPICQQKRLRSQKESIHFSFFLFFG